MGPDRHARLAAELSMRGVLRVAVAVFSLAACALVGATRAQEATDGDAPAPRTIAELRDAIDAILDQTSTPGAGVALVGRAETVWAAGLG